MAWLLNLIAQFFMPTVPWVFRSRARAIWIDGFLDASTFWFIVAGLILTVLIIRRAR